MDPYFYVFFEIINIFFTFSFQTANITRSNCAIISSNLSKKNKLALYQTKTREPNYIDHKILL